MKLDFIAHAWIYTYVEIFTKYYITSIKGAGGGGLDMTDHGNWFYGKFSESGGLGIPTSSFLPDEKYKS